MTFSGRLQIWKLANFEVPHLGLNILSHDMSKVVPLQDKKWILAVQYFLEVSSNILSSFCCNGSLWLRHQHWKTDLQNENIIKSWLSFFLNIFGGKENIANKWCKLIFWHEPGSFTLENQFQERTIKSCSYEATRLGLKQRSVWQKICNKSNGREDVIWSGQERNKSIAQIFISRKKKMDQGEVDAPKWQTEGRSIEKSDDNTVRYRG